MSAFTGLKQIAQRVAKLEQKVKYILTHCCGGEPVYPTVDFIVDLFDRGDNTKMGRYWNDSSAFALSGEELISKKGGSMDWQDGQMWLSANSSVTTVGNWNLLPSKQDITRRRIRRLEATIDEALSTLTLAAYNAHLSSINHTVEIGFTVTVQEYENAIPPWHPVLLDDNGVDVQCAFGYELDDWGIPLSSITSNIRPVARYDADTGNGAVAFCSFGCNNGWDWSVSTSISYTLNAFSTTSSTWIKWSETITASNSASDAWAQETYVSDNIQLGTFTESVSATVFTAHAPPEWNFSNGYLCYRFDTLSLIDPAQWEPFDWYDGDARACADWFTESLTPNDPDYACRCVHEYNISGGYTRHWTDNYTGNACHVSSGGTCYDYHDYYPPSTPWVYTYMAANAYTHKLALPRAEDHGVRVGENTLRFILEGNTMTVAVNGRTLASVSQNSVTTGDRVGLFAFGDSAAWAAGVGLTQLPKIQWFRAWNHEVMSEPPLTESGHGLADGTYLDGYHSDDEYNPTVFD